MAAIGWERAWAEALYGTRGFYRQDGPAAHFSTAAQGPYADVLAGALLRLAAREGCARIVDIGCGRGELVTALRALDPDIPLLGVDVVDRPSSLPTDIEWLPSPGGTALPDDLRDLTDALVVAHEWLDVVPCPVLVVAGDLGLHPVLVDPVTGEETVSPHHLDRADPDAAWVRSQWPVEDVRPDARIEVGLPRDEAWAALLARMVSGVAVAVDYGHTRSGRPPGGTLAAYRRGSAVAPVPDGSCDLTAHVAMDSLVHDELVTQREALRGLGVDGRTPPRDLAVSDPAGYLQALAQTSTAASLLAPGGFGGFWWALRRVG